MSRVPLTSSIAIVGRSRATDCRERYDRRPHCAQLRLVRAEDDKVRVVPLLDVLVGQLVAQLDAEIRSRSLIRRGPLPVPAERALGPVVLRTASVGAMAPRRSRHSGVLRSPQCRIRSTPFSSGRKRSKTCGPTIVSWVSPISAMCVAASKTAVGVLSVIRLPFYRNTNHSYYEECVSKRLRRRRASSYHLVHRLGKVFRTVDAASGLPSAQLSALVTIVMHGPLGMGALAAYELVAPHSVTRVVDSSTPRTHPSRCRRRRPPPHSREGDRPGAADRARGTPAEDRLRGALRRLAVARRSTSGATVRRCTDADPPLVTLVDGRDVAAHRVPSLGVSADRTQRRASSRTPTQARRTCCAGGSTSTAPRSCARLTARLPMRCGGRWWRPERVSLGW